MAFKEHLPVSYILYNYISNIYSICSFTVFFFEAVVAAGHEEGQPLLERP